MRAEMELREHHEDLTARERELRELRRSVADTSRAVAELSRSNADLNRGYTAVTASNARLTRSNAELTDSNARLTRETAETRRQLAESQLERTRAERALGDERTRRQTAEVQAESAERREREIREALERERRARAAVGDDLARGSAERERQKRQIAVLAHDLNKNARELARAKDELARQERDIKRLQLTLGERETESRERERLLRIGIEDLRRARAELEAERVRLAEARTRLAAQRDVISAKDRTIQITADQLAQANKKLLNRVVQNYSGSALKLEVDIREALMLGREQRGGGVFYLPYLELDGKTFIVGHLYHFMGNMNDRSLSFKKVTQAALFVSIPGAKQKGGTPLTGPVLLANGEPRLAAVRTRINGRKPLRVLTIDELRDRSGDGLFLFKARSAGSEYMEITDRCSIDISGALFIRNSGARDELQAEPGDLILTRSGEFAALAVEEKSRPRGNRHGEVRAFVMPNTRVWDSPKFTITYAKPRDARYFTGFERDVQRILAELDPEKRRRR